VDVLLATLRIAECSGKPFMYMEHLIREAKWLASNFSSIIPGVNDLKRGLKLHGDFFLVRMRRGNLAVKLSPEGVSRADRLLGTVRIPQRVNIIQRNPYKLSLETLYVFQNIDFKTYCRHYYFVDIRFVNNDLEFVDDISDATDAVGVVRVITRGRKEDVYVNTLSDDLLTKKPKIALLFMFSLHKFDELCRVDRVLAETLVGTCGIKNLFGCRIENGSVIWGDKRLL